MHRLVTALIVVFTVAASTFAAPTIAGKWTVSSDTPHGAMTLALVLKLDKEVVTGTLAHEQMGEMDVKGELKDGKLSFFVTTPQGKLEFNGKLKDDDTIVGTITSPMGDLAFTATRVKEK